MARQINCAKYGIELDGLERPPLPGPLGQRIYAEISRDAWQEWLGQQTILINEFRLSVVDPKARAYLEKEMERFLFGGRDYVPEPYPAA